MFPVAETLSACPNLVSFSICPPYAYDFSSLPMTPWPNLTALTFHSELEPFTRDQVISVCQRFPALKELDLFPCEDIDLVLMIPRYCPLLKSVEVEMYSMGIWDFSTPLESLEMKSLQLRSLLSKQRNGIEMACLSILALCYGSIAQHLRTSNGYGRLNETTDSCTTSNTHA